MATFPHDVATKSELTAIYNQPVVEMQHWQRPLEGWPECSTKISLGENHTVAHSGMMITTATGDKYLVHKGGNFGISSQTVLVNADHMSDK